MALPFVSFWLQERLDTVHHSLAVLQSASAEHPPAGMQLPLLALQLPLRHTVPAVAALQDPALLPLS